MKKLITMSILGTLILSYSVISYAHSGRTDASGGHYNRKTGGYHYHNSGYKRPTPLIPVKDPAIEIAKLKVTIKKYEKTIRLARKKIVELKKENKRLLRLCKQAGIDTRPKRDKHFAPPIRLGVDGKPLGFTKIAVGEIGWVITARIKQIVDDANAIVTIALNDKYGRLIWSRNDYLSETLWLTGISTKGYADDTGIKLTCLCVIISTKSYTTVTGAKRTLYVMKPITEDEWLRIKLMEKDKKIKSTIEKTN